MFKNSIIYHSPPPTSRPPLRKNTRKITINKPPSNNTTVDTNKNRNSPTLPQNMEENIRTSKERALLPRASSIKEGRALFLKKSIEDEYQTGRANMRIQKNKQRQEIQYNLLENTKENFNRDDSSSSKQSIKHRIMRIRSNDSTRKRISSEAQVITVQNKLKSLKQENIFFKEVQTQSLKRLSDLEKQFDVEKDRFQIQKKSYQKHIEVLRKKISKNKNDIGHLFSYQNYDPTKLVVHPIVEMQGEESSLMRSDQFKNSLKRKQVLSEYGIKPKQSKNVNSQTTGITSLQDYCEQDLF